MMWEKKPPLRTRLPPLLIVMLLTLPPLSVRTPPLSMIAPVSDPSTVVRSAGRDHGAAREAASIDLLDTAARHARDVGGAAREDFQNIAARDDNA